MDVDSPPNTLALRGYTGGRLAQAMPKNATECQRMPKNAKECQAAALVVTRHLETLAKPNICGVSLIRFDMLHYDALFNASGP